MKSPEEKLRKTIKSLRLGRWVILVAACFQFVASGVVYIQGKQVNEIIGREEYGVFFWGSLEVEKSYRGWEILAENRYSTAMLYLGSGLFMCILGLSGFLMLRRDTQLLSTIEQLKREQDD